MDILYLRWVFISSAVSPFRADALHVAARPSATTAADETSPVQPPTGVQRRPTDSLFDRRPVTLVMGNESPACFAATAPATVKVSVSVGHGHAA